MPFPESIPFQKIENEITQLHKVNLYVLRLDTIDLYAGGNKLFKLKYNLEEAVKQGYKKILTFGGAWSNHLVAVASINNRPLPIIAVVRGEEPAVYSDTLTYCKEKGVQLHFVSREAYRNKIFPEFIEELKNKFGDFKPDTYSGIGNFLRRIKKGKLPSNTERLPYDSQTGKLK